jgi:hypothetical protein
MMIGYPPDPTRPSAARGALARGVRRLRAGVLRVAVVLPSLVPAAIYGPAPAMAQSPTPAAGSLSGAVVDVVTSLPVDGVAVTLELAGGGLLVDPASGMVAAVRVVHTGPGGTYRFSELSPGRYTLRFERFGYRGATVEVDLRRPVEGVVSVGLTVEPVVLAPILVESRAASLFQRAANLPSEPEEARAAVERLRQAMFLTSDARVLTFADVADGVTLGEGDVFRALQRFPGVATRDDYSAELWTRGAPWTHTRVTFDGIPLFNPLHAVGALSAITPEILGTVAFHPGVRPASAAEGAAGAVDLRTRAGGGDGSVRGTADFSLASTKVALEQAVPGRGAWLLTGRRSHLGLLSGGLGRLGLDTLDLPYLFQDIAGRADLELGGRTRIEVSGIWEEDRFDGDVAGVLERTRARWGNTAGRATLWTAIGGLELGQTVGGSLFSSRTTAHVIPGLRPDQTWTEPASRNEIRHLRVSGELTPAGGTAARPWSSGYDVAWSEGRYDGPWPRYHAVRPDTSGSLSYAAALTVVGLWGETRVAVGNRLTLNPGLRIEGGTPAANAGSLRASPRFAARYSVSGEQSVSFAAGRSWQYVQAIALAGPSIHPAFHASHFWVWAGQDSPAVRSDLATLGTERWLGGGWLASTTVYVRRATGVTVPDPAPGRVSDRPIFVEGTNLAHGLDASLRRVGAGWSASLGYGYGESKMEAGEHRFPSPAERHHVLDLMAGVGLTSSLRLAGAFTAMSGAPFTRAYTRSPQDCSTFGFGCDDPEGSWVESANAERTPEYASLDASIRWSRSFGGVRLSAYGQVRNVLGRDNATTYSGTVPAGRIVRGSGSEILWDDRFERGLPRMLLLGIQVGF